MSDKLISAKSKLEKLSKKISWHEDRIAKLESSLSELTDKDRIFWTNCDLEIARGEYDTAKKNFDKYAKYVSKIEAKEKEWEEKSNIPLIFVDFKNSLIDSWNKYDKEERDRILSQGTDYYILSNGESDWRKYDKYNKMVSLTDERIEEDNEKAAVSIISSLIERVKAKVGEIKDFSHLHVANANEWTDGGVAINGYVEGDKGKVEVKSILAGGQIQRLHYRTLVHLF